ncbi:MAG TPA: sulfotransferase [Myxococcota bacterium]|nr:sulfotransferase [Myxococcota bacterium]
MSWTPPERPDWVRAINEGRIPPIAEQARRPLERDALVGEAAARLGLDARSAAGRIRALGRPGFESEPVVENLDRLLQALEDEADLHATGRWLTRRFLLRLLEVRFQILAWLDADPGVVDEEIAVPLFVAGAPRTGTTILHALLAADPRHRVPLGWELLRPVPPPTATQAGEAEDPRIALADRELVAPQTVVSGLSAIHEYGGRKPKECLSAMSFAFQSEEFTARYDVPSYARWLEASDMMPAYAMHRLVLQLLQRRTGPAAWVLKSPVHLHSLPTLLATYRDARIAVTHRDPLVLLASLTSLIASLRFAHSERVDPQAIARGHVERYAATFDQLVDWADSGALPAERTHHSHFRDFQRDALGIVRGLYAGFGIGPDEEAERAMRSVLESERSEGPGRHAYDPLPAAALAPADRSRFDRYRTRFAVPSEA